ncbi:MAG: hypothetical protein P0120_04655 [Nitrospira sp.]|nr:hypothetical protein [Nitrospira sp.]
MKGVLVLAAAGEAATGVALLVVPSLVGRFLLGEELNGVGIPVARVAGIALIALGVACWPGSDPDRSAFQPVLGMLCYSLFATLYLAYLGIGGEWVGSLLWPAVAVHAIFTILLVRMLVQ